MLAADASAYLFILETCLCPFGRPVKFETKRGKSLLVWGTLKGTHDQPQHLHHLQSAQTQTTRRAHALARTDALGGTSSRQKLADTLVQTPISIFSFFLCSLFALPFSPGRFRVPQMCHQTLVSIWTWGKKEILDRKLYKKRTLWIFDILRTAASKWVGWRGKEKQLQDRFLFICCLFSLSPFREMEASTRPQLTHPCIQGLSAGPWKENWHS